MSTAASTASTATMNAEMQSFAARLASFQAPHQLGKRRASSQGGGGGGRGKKAAANVLEWPHEKPAVDDLARAGFFYRPSQDSPDNVQCFSCAVKLDGWEPTDDALSEHRAHSPNCHWALCLHAAAEADRVLEQQQSKQEDGEDGEEKDNPNGPLLLGARAATFATHWPHESKRGWKCKIPKMAEAGWCFDPATATNTSASDEVEEDGVTCFYCLLSLDGWEPKDDPWEEHWRRSPGCSFFALVEKFGGAAGGAAGKKGKGKGGKAAKGKGRGSRSSVASTTAKKGDRLSVASAVFVAAEGDVDDVGSLADIEVRKDEEAELATADDSLTSVASQPAGPKTAKGKKKAGRPKAAAKGAKGRKRGSTMQLEAEPESLYPDLSAQVTTLQIADNKDVAMANATQPLEAEETPEEPAPPPPPPAKKTRKATRASKQPLDSSFIEISSIEVTTAPPKKTTRGRKAKAQPAAPPPEPEPEPEAENLDNSEVSAQLQEELERSMTFNALKDEDEEDAVPPPPPPHATAPGAKRGVKRTSDGSPKRESEDVTAVMEEFPAPPSPPQAKKQPPAASKAKGKKGPKTRKASVQPASTTVATTTTEQENEAVDVDADVRMSESEPEPAPVKPTKAKTRKASAAGSAKKGAKKGKKTSTASSTRSSKLSTTATEDEESTLLASQTHRLLLDDDEAAEDLERDERAIEAELARMEAEEAERERAARVRQVEVETERAKEFEASPENARKREKGVIEVLEDEEQQEEVRGDVEEMEEVEAAEEGNWEQFGVSSPDAVPVLPAIDAVVDQEDEKDDEPVEEVQPTLPDTNTGTGTAPSTPASSSGDSDKENQPSSIWIQPDNKRTAPSLSPSKKPTTLPPTTTTTTTTRLSKTGTPQTITKTTTTRVPLAPSTPPIPRQPLLSPSKQQRSAFGGTPNRAALTPRRAAGLLSPSKPLPQLSTTVPWVPIDIAAVAAELKADLPFPSTTSDVENADGETQQTFTKEERAMTVEEWMVFRAERDAEVFRRRCEGLVTRFEREGLRALESLGGVVVGQ